VDILIGIRFPVWLKMGGGIEDWFAARFRGSQNTSICANVRPEDSGDPPL
jgi:hypothetical protein